MTRDHKADCDSCHSGDDDTATSSVSPSLSPTPSSSSSVMSSSSSLSPVAVPTKPTKPTSHTLSFGISRILDDSPRKKTPHPQTIFPYPHPGHQYPDRGISDGMLTMTSPATYMGAATLSCFPERAQTTSPGVIKVPAHHPGTVVHFPPYPTSSMFPWMADRTDVLTSEWSD